MDSAAPPISIAGLSKQYGPVSAVRSLSFDVRPGAVTGFLGPNGAGKTTTIRMLLGLIGVTGGTANVYGQPYSALKEPGKVIGAALDGAAAHPSHTGIGHLLSYAPVVGVSDERCHEVLAQVGLADAAKRKVGKYSFGMRQRLSLATALLGDPQILVLDEPTLGLDPDGISWLWQFLRAAAADGRTVFVSSHSLGEMQEAIDDAVIIADGELRFHGSLDDLRAQSKPATFAEAANFEGLRSLAAEQQWETHVEGKGLRIVDHTPAQIGAAMFAAGLEVHGLEARGASLTDSFFRLTQTTDANQEVVA